MAMIKCNNCGKMISDSEKKCPYCDEVPNLNFKCPKCGSKNVSFLEHACVFDEENAPEEIKKAYNLYRLRYAVLAGSRGATVGQSPIVRLVFTVVYPIVAGVIFSIPYAIKSSKWKKKHNTNLNDEISRYTNLKYVCNDCEQKFKLENNK